MESQTIPSKITPIHGKKEVFILSIDGGGIRGLIPTRIIQEIEHITKRHPTELFDFIAGTSIGGIISLALTTPSKDQKPQNSSDKVMEMFLKHGVDIFKKSVWKKIESAGGLTDEAYEATGLESTLKLYYGDTTLSQSLVPTVATSFELEKNRPYNFRSYDSANDFTREFCGRSTSAWPCLFELAQGTNLKGERFCCVDGGVVIVNPAEYAFDEAKILYPDAEKIVVVSIGTGECDQSFPGKEAKDWGVIKWFGPLLKILNDSQIHIADENLRKKIAKEDYFRLQVMLTPDENNIDDGSQENLGKLLKKTEEFLQANKDAIDKICQVLTKERKK